MLDAPQLLAHLRSGGITAHHAAPVVGGAGGAGALVVFLEGTLDQAEQAAERARQLDGVAAVEVAGRTGALIYVTLR